MNNPKKFRSLGTPTAQEDTSLSALELRGLGPDHRLSATENFFRMIRKAALGETVDRQRTERNPVKSVEDFNQRVEAIFNNANGDTAAIKPKLNELCSTGSVRALVYMYFADRAEHGGMGMVRLHNDYTVAVKEYETEAQDAAGELIPMLADQIMRNYQVGGKISPIASLTTSYKYLCSKLIQKRYDLEKKTTSTDAPQPGGKEGEGGRTVGEGIAEGGGDKPFMGITNHLQNSLEEVEGMIQDAERGARRFRDYDPEERKLLISTLHTAYQRKKTVLDKLMANQPLNEEEIRLLEKENIPDFDPNAFRDVGKNSPVGGPMGPGAGGDVIPPQADFAGLTEYHEALNSIRSKMTGDREGLLPHIFGSPTPLPPLFPWMKRGLDTPEEIANPTTPEGIFSHALMNASLRIKDEYTLERKRRKNLKMPTKDIKELSQNPHEIMEYLQFVGVPASAQVITAVQQNPAAVKDILLQQGLKVPDMVTWVKNERLGLGLPTEQSSRRKLQQYVRDYMEERGVPQDFIDEKLAYIADESQFSRSGGYRPVTQNADLFMRHGGIEMVKKQLYGDAPWESLDSDPNGPDVQAIGGQVYDKFYGDGTREFTAHRGTDLALANNFPVSPDEKKEMICHEVSRIIQIHQLKAQGHGRGKDVPPSKHQSLPNALRVVHPSTNFPDWRTIYPTTDPRWPKKAPKNSKGMMEQEAPVAEGDPAPLESTGYPLDDTYAPPTDPSERTSATISRVRLAANVRLMRLAKLAEWFEVHGLHGHAFQTDALIASLTTGDDE